MRYDATANAIEATGLVKRFGKTTALDGVDLAARQGRVLGVLGPNGAGKTTAVRILATLLRPDSGQVSVDHVARAGLAQFGPQPEISVCSALPGLPGGSSGQSSPASEPAGTTRPAFSASKVSKTRNWRPPTWTGRPVSSRT
jgi:ABC-type transport system involved in cytochrome bd biosynthesis fused ATPase/permease subunit